MIRRKVELPTRNTSDDIFEIRSFFNSHENMVIEEVDAITINSNILEFTKLIRL